MIAYCPLDNCFHSLFISIYVYNSFVFRMVKTVKKSAKAVAKTTTKKKKGERIPDKTAKKKDAKVVKVAKVSDNILLHFSRSKRQQLALGQLLFRGAHL